jgi:predicted Zn-dependent protease
VLLNLARGRQDALAGRLLKRMIGTGFSRQQELLADKDALKALGASGIDPAALARALRHMQPADGEDLRTLRYVSKHHPAVDERVKLAEAAAAAWTGKARPLEVQWSEFGARFQFIR